MSEEDRSLVEAVLARRDERAFVALYDRHASVMYGLALRLSGGDAPEAQTILHDAWVAAVERLASFEWRAELRTWLCAFVVNGARALAREAGRHPGPDIEDLPLGREDERLTGAIARVDLERAVAGLPPGYRHVFVLHDVEGYTHDEIATHLGITPGTSKSQLSRARGALRRALAPEGV
ncbi:MAG TPA: RNA polymerase sigma factor [Gemmatimonadales bacterium]